MLNQLKRGALGVMHRSGASHAIELSRWRRARLLILGYHGISQDDEHLWNPELYLSPAQLQSQLETIAAGGFHVLGLDEAVTRLYAGRLPEKSLCITFDDGTVDFHRIAAPMLRAFGFPVTLYLTTYYCLTGRPVFPSALNYVLWKGRARGSAPYPAALGAADTMDLATAEGRETARRRIWSFAEQQDLSGADKHALLAEVAHAVGYDLDAMVARRVHHLMTPEEVAAAARDGVDVQLHTHRHRRPLERDLYRREIRDNREVIEQLTGRTPVHFCYPSGQTHPQFLGWLAEEGVVSATTCRGGIATARSNPLLLPRLICTSRITPVEFTAWLSGTAALLPRKPLAKPWEPVPQAD